MSLFKKLFKKSSNMIESSELVPDSAMAYYNRGVAYRDSGNVDAAYLDFLAAARIDPVCQHEEEGEKDMQKDEPVVHHNLLCLYCYEYNTVEIIK
jgi:tetratricopeptide (TPR) repeat protein